MCWAFYRCMRNHIDGLVQERRNSIANALELRLSCTNLSIYASVNWIIIGSCNGLLPVQHQAVSCPYSDVLSNESVIHSSDLCKQWGDIWWQIIIIKFMMTWKHFGILTHSSLNKLMNKKIDGGGFRRHGGQATSLLCLLPYRLWVYSEESVPLFGPPLPCPAVFFDHEEFRDFLLVKCKYSVCLVP